MARPERNNVDYFPFYCEDGKKMFYLEETYGNDGFAVFIKILKELAKTDYHYLNLSENTTLMFLSAKCKVSKETLKCIITDLSTLGKFNKVLWDENNIIWCQDFIDSIQDAYKKRKNKCITYDSLVVLLISLGVRKPSKLPSKGGEKPQRKEKKTKEEQKKKRKTEFSNSLSRFLGEYDKDLLNEFFRYWTESNENGFKMRFELSKNQPFGFERRISTFLKNQKKWEKEKSSDKKENIMLTDVMLQREGISGTIITD